MQYRELGRAGLRVSRNGFGAGPVSGLMVGDSVARQTETVRRALELGINWFDTAPTYGDGRSERSLGSALRSVLSRGSGPDRSGAGRSREGRVGVPGGDVHVATKVRLSPAQLGDVRRTVIDSFETSLERMGLERVTLLQLHNSVTAKREQLPTSVTPADVLGEGGVVEAFEELRSRGLVAHFGFTGLGDAASLETLIRDGPFATVQVPYSLLTPVSGTDRSAGSRKNT